MYLMEHNSLDLNDRNNKSVQFYRERQKTELERTDSYTDDKYVLWLVCDMFSEYADVKKGTVHIFTEDKEIIVQQVTRKPYPNKCISQISMCCGKRKLYGIPLVFDTFEELQKIRNIIIVWDQYCIAFNEKRERIKTWAQNIECYSMNFIKGDEKIYTLLSKTYPFFSNRFENYLEEFQLCQVAFSYPNSGSSYIMSDSEIRTDSFAEACDKLVIPGVKRKLKTDLDISTAALAFGVGWKESEVYKSVIVLSADASLKGEYVSNFGLPFSTASKLPSATTVSDKMPKIFAVK